MAKQAVKLKWSKKENDWLVSYPDRNGKILGGVLAGMITDFEKFMSKDVWGNKTDFKDFRDHLIRGGYDPDTFTITCKKKE